MPLFPPTEKLQGFLAGAMDFIGHEQSELQRLRQKTYCYLYGSLIAPLMLSALSGGAATVAMDAFVFFGAPVVMYVLPKPVQRLLGIVLTTYNLYKKSASTLASVSAGWLLTKAIEQIDEERCYFDFRGKRYHLKTELKGLLLVLIDTSILSADKLKKAVPAAGALHDRLKVADEKMEGVAYGVLASTARTATDISWRAASYVGSFFTRKSAPPAATTAALVDAVDDVPPAIQTPPAAPATPPSAATEALDKADDAPVGNPAPASAVPREDQAPPPSTLTQAADAADDNIPPPPRAQEPAASTTPSGPAEAPLARDVVSAPQPAPTAAPVETPPAPATTPSREPAASVPAPLSETPPSPSPAAAPPSPSGASLPPAATAPSPTTPSPSAPSTGNSGSTPAAPPPSSTWNRWCALPEYLRQWKIHENALNAAKAVYGRLLPCMGEAPPGLVPCSSLTKTISGLTVKGYLDPVTNIVYFAFKGTSVWQDLINDLGLFLTGRPLTATNELADWIKAWQARHPNKIAILTGHSLGAAIASYISSKTGLSAVTFENPGLRGSRFDLSRVISYQSRNNIINGFNRWIRRHGGGSPAQYGFVIRLPFPGTVARIISAIPIVGGALSHLLAYLVPSFAVHLKDRADRGLAPCGPSVYSLPVTAPQLRA